MIKDLHYYISKIEKKEIKSLYIRINEDNRKECQEWLLNEGVRWNSGHTGLLFLNGGKKYRYYHLGWKKSENRVGIAISNDFGFGISKTVVVKRYEELRDTTFDDLFEDLFD